MDWKEKASKGCRSIRRYFPKSNGNASRLYQHGDNFNAGSCPSGRYDENCGELAGSQVVTAEEELNLPRKRLGSNGPRDDVPMNIRDRLCQKRKAFNAQASTMSADQGVLAGVGERIKQRVRLRHGSPSGTALAQSAVLQNVTNMDRDTTPITPEEQDVATCKSDINSPSKETRSSSHACPSQQDVVGPDSSGSEYIHSRSTSSEQNTSASIQETYLCTLNGQNRSIVEKDLNDLDYLSDFVRRTCSGKIDNFKDRLIACSRKLRHRDAVQRLFDVDTIVSSSDASDEIFSSADEAIKKPLTEYYKVRKAYIQNPEYVDLKGIDMVKITKEICLDDELQEFSLALIALLASEYENSVEGLYDALERAIEQNVGREHRALEDIRESFTECMKVFLQPHLGPKWKIRQFDENVVIPTKYEHIFPKTIRLYEFVEEGLRMSLERMFAVLVFPEAISFSRQLNATGMYASHVLLPRQYKTDDGVQWRYTLHQDFFFGTVPLGDESYIYVSTEGRCINTRSESLGVPSSGKMSPKFLIDTGSKHRKFLIHQGVGMAKYDLTPSQFFEKCGSGMSTDHLTMQTFYNQPALLMIADQKQQASNKRPPSRETFRSQSLEDLSDITQFRYLSNKMKAIAQRCKDNCEKNGLLMVRLKEGDNWELDDPHSSEKWVNVVRSTNIHFFEKEQCIWRERQDRWIFLDDVMGTPRRAKYREISIARKLTRISCSIAYTKLYAAVLGKHEISKEFLHEFQLEDIAKCTNGDGVQIKTAWRRDDGITEKLAVDHINGQTGLHRSDNLRMLTNWENTALSCGKLRRATISNNGNKKAVTGKSISHLARKIRDTMREMGYTDEELPSQKAASTWISEKKIPKSLQGKIVIEYVDDQKDYARFFPSNVYWFLGKFKNKVTGEIHEEAYRGNECMVAGIKKNLSLSESDDSSWFVDVAHMYDEKYRREVIRKMFSPIGEGSRYALVDVYSSYTWIQDVKSKDYKEKSQALRVRREQHHNDRGFREIPPRNKAERNAEYDLNDGNGPRKFNLGHWINYEVRAYKRGKRTNEHMEKLMDAMGLSEEARSDFKRRCEWRVDGVPVYVCAYKEKSQALRVRREQHDNDTGFREIPPDNEAERNAEYDLNDGNGPRKFNLGNWVKNEMGAYKKGRRTNEHMEKLTDAMGLSEEARTVFKRRCGWRV